MKGDPGNRDPNKARGTVSKMGQGTRRRLKRQILDRDGPVCAWDECEFHGFIDVNIQFPDPRSFTRDHILPRSKGGSDHIDNMQGMHKLCNEIKSDKIQSQLPPPRGARRD